MADKLKSRKLWITILGGVVIGIYYPAMLPAYLKIAVPTYLGAQGIADAAAALNAKSK